MSERYECYRIVQSTITFIEIDIWTNLLYKLKPGVKIKCISIFIKLIYVKFKEMRTISILTWFIQETRIGSTVYLFYYYAHLIWIFV